MTDSVAAVVATLVALAFTLSTLERYLARRTRHELSWSVALALFAIASGALAVGATTGWTGVTFRIFYLLGAIVNVPVLALGTVYLLAGRRWGDGATALVAIGSLGATVVIVTAAFKNPLPRHGLTQGSHVFGAVPQVLAGVGSGAGTIVIVIGAIYSAARHRRSRLAAANILIALGTLITGASGIANSGFDKMTAFAVALGLGLIVIFVGFFVASPERPSTSDIGGQPASVKRAAR